SQNTVKAFLKNIEKDTSNKEQEPTPISEIRAYCVGEKTGSLLEQNGIHVLESAHYGAELAKILVSKYQKESFLFLCGDKRLTAIPSQFQQHSIRFKEQVVYGNSTNIQSYRSDFNGILFFSPSGIESFVIKNQIKDSTCFCIGTTKTAAAKTYVFNSVVRNAQAVEGVSEAVTGYLIVKINRPPVMYLMQQGDL